MGLIFLKESVAEGEKSSKGPIVAKASSSPKSEEAFRHSLKSHWGLTSMKLMLS